jgi:malate synthase
MSGGITSRSLLRSCSMCRPCQEPKQWLGYAITLEDAATAEISRSQVWQCVHSNLRFDTGETVTADLVRRILDEELAAIRVEIGDQAFDSSRFDDARQLFEQVALADDFADFLTLPAYAMVD